MSRMACRGRGWTDWTGGRCGTAVCGRDDKVKTKTFTAWRRGDKAPRSATNFRVLVALARMVFPHRP